MEKQHLHLLINEEIYRIGGDEVAETTIEGTIQKEEIVEEEVDKTRNNDVDATSQVSELEPESIKEEAKQSETPEIPKPTKESPKIPEMKTQEEVVTEIPLAIFHDSTNPAEMELLQKIIDACKVPSDDYVIFKNGFDQSVKFKKGLVFVPKAKAFYTPIPYKNSHFLCSKPLSDLANDQQEKGKLWVALQRFVLSK